MQDKETAISVKNLKKFYGRKIAVNGVHLNVKIGEVFSLLGPNGAGKTSIVEILEGHRKKTSGDVDVLGFDPGLNQQGLKKWHHTPEPQSPIAGYFVLQDPDYRLVRLVYIHIFQLLIS